MRSCWVMPSKMGRQFRTLTNEKAGVMITSFYLKAEFMDSLKSQCELWRVICELDLLGESAELLYRPFGQLSPGERTKKNQPCSLWSTMRDFVKRLQPGQFFCNQF